MQNSTSVNVLPLDRKDQKFDDKNLSRRLLKPDHTKDKELTDFGKATLIDRYLLPGENFNKDMFLRVAKSYSDNDAHAKRIYRIYFKPMVLCRQLQFFPMAGRKEVYLSLVF